MAFCSRKKEWSSPVKAALTISISVSTGLPEVPYCQLQQPYNVLLRISILLPLNFVNDVPGAIGYGLQGCQVSQCQVVDRTVEGQAADHAPHSAVRQGRPVPVEVGVDVVVPGQQMDALKPLFSLQLVQDRLQILLYNLFTERYSRFCIREP